MPESLPAKPFLSLYANRRMATLIGLGFASGLPFMLTGRTMTVWARDRGVDLGTIGLFSLLTLPYALKFLWAPVLDRFMAPVLGRRRGWILIAQVLLIAAVAAMAVSGPMTSGQDLRGFAIAAFAVAFFSATQDIVADAYRTDVLEDRELGPGASVYQTGYRLAMLASGAGAVWLASQTSWSTVYLVAAGAMSVGVVATLLAPEPHGPASVPRTFVEAVIEPAREFLGRMGLSQCMLVLLFIVMFKLPDYMAEKMTDPLLLDLKFTKEQIALWGLGAGTAVTIPGVLVGGLIIARLGLLRALIIFGIAQALSNAGYLVVARAGHVESVMIAVIGIEYLCKGLVASGFVAFLMSQCDRRFSATQYALLSSVMGLSSSFAGTPTGWLVERCGYQWFFVITIAMGIPGLLMLPFLNLRKPTGEPISV